MIHSSVINSSINKAHVNGNASGNANGNGNGTHLNGAYINEIINEMDKAPKDYCNVLAAQLGLDPAGYAGTFKEAVLIETPLPWRRKAAEMTGVMPQEVTDLLAQWMDDYHAGLPYDKRLLLIAPDPATSVQGLRTVIFYAMPQQPFARFVKMEYRVPEAALGPLVWAWFKEPAQLEKFDRYRRADADALRDILVCTHGTVDVACAKFGYPLYKMLREQYHDDVSTRVWRVSHFGGHVFAPTLIDMPTGHYWAYVGTEQARQIVTQQGDVRALNGHYRGWSGLDAGFMQAAERAMWQDTGWAWFTYAKRATIVEQDTNEDEPRWATVRVEYAAPHGACGAYTARVEVTHTVETITGSGRSEAHAYAQYAVTHLTQTRAEHAGAGERSELST